MKNGNVKRFLPLNLQFFAEDNKDGDNQNDDSNNNQNDNSNQEGQNDNKDNDDSNDNSGEKTFTQSQVTSMMAKEKNEGKKAILNALGFKNINDVKKILEDAKNSSEMETANKELEVAKSEAEQRALAAENKLACVMAGVNKDSVDDVLSIALTKVTDKKTLTNVIEEMKSIAKYSGFFGTEESGGTGSDVGHIGGNSKNESIGKRLAKQNSTSATNTKKSSYFK